jgi:hypothetical protein
MQHGTLLLHRRMRGVVMTAVVFAAAACATASRQVTDMERCTGGVELVVRNHTAGPIDVYRNAPEKQFLATVPVGTRTVLIWAQERGGGYLFYSGPAPDQDAQFLGFGDRRSRGRVEFEERCRSTG